MRAVVVSVLTEHSQRKAADMADDNVAQWGSYAIYVLASGDAESSAPWLAAGAERVLLDIADTSDTSFSFFLSAAKTDARKALERLRRQA